MGESTFFPYQHLEKYDVLADDALEMELKETCSDKKLSEVSNFNVHFNNFKYNILICSEASCSTTWFIERST